MQSPNLIGQTFGRLKVIRKTSERRSGCVLWLCKCHCGNYVKVTTNDLRNNHTKSCGCYKRERTIEVNSKYHISDKLLQHRLYVVWYKIKERCYNKNEKSYKYYGGRGIKMCDEWRNDFKSFFNWAVNNGYAKGLTIDRIDNNGIYCPENCRWATYIQQQNNRRSCHYVTIGNETKSLSDWCRVYSTSERLVNSRVQRGWDVITALNTPKTRNRLITLNNVTKTFLEWCEYYLIDSKTVNARLRRGWNIEKAIITPKINTTKC